MTRMRVWSIAVLASCAVLAPAMSAGQTRQTTTTTTMTPWTFGIKAGATLSTLQADNNADLDIAWGGTAGVFAGSNITRNLGVQIEALVGQRGAKNDAGGDRTLRITYLDVPVFLRLGNTQTNHVHVHAFTGLTPGFKLDSKLTDNASTLTIGVTDKIKGFDLGWVFGVALEHGPWQFDARYTFGLVDVNDLAGGADIKNRSAGFNVGYRLR